MVSCKPAILTDRRKISYRINKSWKPAIAFITDHKFQVNFSYSKTNQ
jgi:hypothetical protein